MSETPDPSTAAGTEPDDSASTAPDESVRERFRAALDKKNAAPGTHPGSHAEGGAHLKGSNDKRERQFRRKSGG